MSRGSSDHAPGASPADQLRERQLRVTPQRRAILGAFRGTAAEHLSADEVHARATASVPEVSRGTVYATLAELTELGLLAAFGNPEPVRYESNVAPHEHFRCHLCLRLFDVDIPAPRLSTLKRQGFVVERTTVLAEGICGDCGAYEQGLEEGVAELEETAQLSAELVETLACMRHASPLGVLLLAATPAGMVRVAFENAADAPRLEARAHSRRGGRAARDHLRRAADGIDSYFAGERPALNDVIDWSAVSGVSRSALEATRAIPYADQCSYETLDTDTGPRECGRTMGSNPMPILFPCHRVTRGAQTPLPYVGGQHRRVQLLSLEDRATT